MGSKVSRLVRGVLARNERRLLLVGLDNAGKTCACSMCVWDALAWGGGRVMCRLLPFAWRPQSPPVFAPRSRLTTTRSCSAAVMFQLRIGKPVKTVPTVGFNVETIKHKKLTLHLWVRNDARSNSGHKLAARSDLPCVNHRMLVDKIGCDHTGGITTPGLRCVLSVSIGVTSCGPVCVNAYTPASAPFLTLFVVLCLQGIIYVIDSVDKARLDLSAAELHTMLADDQLAVRGVRLWRFTPVRADNSVVRPRTLHCSYWRTSKTWKVQCQLRKSANDWTLRRKAAAADIQRHGLTFLWVWVCAGTVGVVHSRSKGASRPPGRAWRKVLNS